MSWPNFIFLKICHSGSPNPKKIAFRKLPATCFLQVNSAKAEAELAYSLQAAKVQARIKEEEMQVKVVERQQNISIQEQEILR